MINVKTRADMFRVLGMLDALAFPLPSTGNEHMNSGHYDLINSIREQYIKILKDTIGYSDE